MFIAAHYSAH